MSHVPAAGADGASRSYGGKLILMDVHTGSRAQATFRLRGREVQIETLCNQLDAVQAGRGGIALVVGQAGMGKTALLDAAEGMSGERGIRVFRGTFQRFLQLTHQPEPLVRGLA